MKNILVLLDPGLEPYRGILHGLGAASSNAEELNLNYLNPNENFLDFLNESEPSLVVCSIRSPDEAKLFRSLGIPVLNVLGTYPVADLPSIDLSKESFFQALGALVTSKRPDHVHWMDASEKGELLYENLARYFSEIEIEASLERGFDVSVHQGKLSQNHLLIFGRDQQALSFLQQNAQLSELRVGLLGLGNDELLCLRSRPFLSSLALDGEGCGREMTHLIDKMLTGLDTGLRPLEIRVDRYEERQSTSWMKAGDDRIQKAMVYFRDNMHLGHNVEELSRHTNMSYRTFHRLFCEETGMSPKSWMDREQFEKAKGLLSRETDPLSKIAAHCGYSDDKALIRAFRRLARKPPSAFRSLSQ